MGLGPSRASVAASASAPASISVPLPLRRLPKFHSGEQVGPAVGQHLIWACGNAGQTSSNGSGSNGGQRQQLCSGPVLIQLFVTLPGHLGLNAC